MLSFILAPESFRCEEAHGYRYLCVARNGNLTLGITQTRFYYDCDRHMTGLALMPQLCPSAWWKFYVHGWSLGSVRGKLHHDTSATK